MTGASRVVLDTNVVLSALLFGGTTGKLRDAWLQGQFVPLVSTATARELIRVLAYPKFRLSAEEREELLAEYLPYAAIVSVPNKALPISCRDPLDVPFLQLALAGRAAALISGDKDPRALAGKFAVPILAPAEFLDTCL